MLTAMQNWPLAESYTFRDQTVRFHVTGNGPPLVQEDAPEAIVAAALRWLD